MFTFTITHINTPLEGDAIDQLDVVAPGGAIQCRNALDCQASCHVVALETGAQVAGGASE